MMTFWCSFADDVFRGVILVDAASDTAALDAINSAGINPGGQVSLLPLPESDGSDEAEATYALPRLTLLLRDDLEKAMAVTRVGDMSEAEIDTLQSHLKIVCESCNEES
jgi:hypothetical protein